MNINETINSIVYINDTELKYVTSVREGLQAYNKIYTGETKQYKQNFYAFSNGKLVGSIYSTSGWDWIYIEKMFYNNINVLKSLIFSVLEYYKGKAFGILYNSYSESRLKDLYKVGFISTGFLNDMPKGYENHFLLCDINTLIEPSKINMESYTDINEEYSKIVEEKNESFIEGKNISKDKIELNVVALDNKEFIGGLYGFIKDDYLYISLAYVEEKFRSRGVASILVNKIEQLAKSYGISNCYLGTCEFQAKPFYEKMGYKVIITMNDYPKGFKEYTLYKKL